MSEGERGRRGQGGDEVGHAGPGVGLGFLPPRRSVGRGGLRPDSGAHEHPLGSLLQYRFEGRRQ